MHDNEPQLEQVAVPQPFASQARTVAARVSSELWELRAICGRWHTVFKRMSHPNAAYSCPWCDADVR
ncbi:hypothetical protein [Leucobacter luti]|uniref:Uncharacterized protein n=1 Tax=Leucobacter luti TaxID=340320 RepID=A0A4Q7TN80_9MICO|nr:hypothetical protein [Leucobacter luti]MBL3700120.1 hypothetical protein [Leucobacter luti]RZT61160.1 hypothetical protein EV139_2913 [Leucobacter luti]